MKATVDAAELAGMLGGLKLGDALIKLEKRQKKEDVVMVAVCAQNNRLRVQLETWDTILTGYNSACKCWDSDVARYTVTAEIYAQVAEEGAYQLSFAVAKKIAKFCTRGDVTVFTNGSRMEITQGKRKSAVAVESAEMVRFPDLSGGVCAPRSAIMSVIGSTATPSDVLNCLHQWVAVEPKAEGTAVSWTDGAQMFWQTCDPDLPGSRRLVPLFALECITALKPADEAIEIQPDGIRCGNIAVNYLEQNPSYYPHTLDVVQQVGSSSAYHAVKTTCEDIRAMLKRLSSCMHDEIVLSGSDGQLRMLSYDNSSEQSKAKCTRWDICPRAETWTAAELEQPFTGIGLHAPRFKRALGRYNGPLTLRIEDAESPVFIEIENSGIRTVLMPCVPSFNRTTID